MNKSGVFEIWCLEINSGGISTRTDGGTKVAFFADRFLYFYYDPYFNFLNWILVDSMVKSGYLTEADVRVVKLGGMPLFVGSEFHNKKYGFGWRRSSCPMTSSVDFRSANGLGHRRFPETLCQITHASSR